jgi:hypothetical protein
MLRDDTFRSLLAASAGLKQLEPICAAWDLAGEIKAGDLVMHAESIIAHRMKSPIAARFVWQRLARNAQRFLYDLLCAKDPGKGVPLARIQRQLDLTSGEVEAIVRHLKAMYVLEEDQLPGRPSAREREQGLSAPPVRALFLYRECAESLWDTGQELFLPYANREKRPLSQLLRLVRWDRVDRLARLCHVSARSIVPLHQYDALLSPGSPQDIFQGIVEALRQAPIFFEVFRSLDPHVQDFFLWLCQRGGKVTMAEAQAHLQVSGCTGSSFYLLFETLESHALAFDTLQEGGERVVFVHQDIWRDVREEINQYVSDERQYALLPVQANPQLVDEGFPRILYDLATCVGWAYQHVLEETREGKLPKRWHPKIRPMLHGRPRIRESEDLYLDLLYFTAKELDLLRCTSLEEEKPSYHPTAFLARFQHMTVAEQTRRFLAWWQQPSAWLDVTSGGEVLAPGKYVVEARKALLAHVRSCSPGEWYRVSSLLYSIWKGLPPDTHDFNTKQAPEQLSLREIRARWMEKGEGQTFLALLLSTLYEAGVLTFGYDDADPQTGVPDLFQLTPLGMAALSQDLNPSGPPPPAGEQQHIIVQPTGEVVLLEFESGLIYRLMQFAMVKSIGRVCSFTLTQDALLRGLVAGNRLDEILGFLTEASRRDLPQNIAYLLRDWAKGYKEARVSSVLLIELLPDTSEVDLSQALADLGVEVRRLSPGLFALAAEALPFPLLRKRLQQAGLVVRGQPTRGVNGRQYDG